ncbi:MAG: hypothetical protein R6X12_05780, partial [bacterium]
MRRIVAVLLAVGAAAGVVTAQPVLPGPRDPAGLGARAIPGDGRPFVVDPEWQPGRPLRECRATAVACGGGRWLVAWQGVVGADDVSSMLVAVVTDDGGRVVAGRPVLLDSGDEDDVLEQVAAAWGGGVYLVCWSVRSGAVMAVTLDSTGRVLRGPFPVFSVTWAVSPAVAFGDGRFLVVWMEPNPGDGQYRIGGAQVTPGGVVLQGDGIRISDSSSCQKYPAVAFDGASFHVAWVGNFNRPEREVRVRRVSAQGVLLDTADVVAGRKSESDYWPVAVAAGGGCAMVAWEGEYGPGADSWGILAARIGPGGCVIDSVPLRVRADSSRRRVGLPELAWTGEAFLTCWQEHGPGFIGLRSRRVWPDGRVDEACHGVEAELASECEGYQFDVAGDGSGLLLSWVEHDVDGNLLCAARLARDGRPGEPGEEVTVRSAAGQLGVAAGASSSGFLVAWVEPDVEEEEWVALRAVTLGRGGRRLGSFRLTAEPERATGFPKVASCGDVCLLAWPGSGDLKGFRFNAEGALLDSVPLDLRALDVDDGRFDLAGGTQGWFAARTRSQRSGTSVVSGGRIGPDGACGQNPTFELDIESGRVSAPALAFNGWDYLVCWRDRDTLRGARVSGSGGLMPGSPFLLASCHDNRLAPAVASCGDGFLVAWLEGEQDGEVLCVRAGAGGEVLDSRGIELGRWSAADRPERVWLAVAADRLGYLVMWQDVLDARPVLRGARVGAGGET